MKRAFLLSLFVFFASLASGQNHLLDSLRDQFHTVGADTNRFNVLVSLTRAARVDYPDTAIRYGQQAELLARNLQDNVRLARALNLLGSAYYYRGEYDSAEQMQRKSIEVCNRYNLVLEKPNALGSLALAFQAQSKFREAIETYYETLKLEETNKNQRGVVKTLANLAILYRNLGDYDNALKCALVSYKILHTSIPDWESAIASAANTIGLSYLDMEKYDSAIIYLQEAYRINKKTGNITFTANSASNIAYSYLKQNKSDSAAHYAEIAYQYFPKISNQAIAGLFLLIWGARDTCKTGWQKL